MDQTDADEMDTAIKDSDNEAEETENESANTPLTRRKRVSEFYTDFLDYCNKFNWSWHTLFY